MKLIGDWEQFQICLSSILVCATHSASNIVISASKCCAIFQSSADSNESPRSTHPLLQVVTFWRELTCCDERISRKAPKSQCIAMTNPIMCLTERHTQI